MTEPTVEQPQVTGAASTAASPRSRWGAIPRHLGRARTSTVVLSLLFLAIGALWINIRPDQPPPPGTVVDQPVAPATTAVPTTPAPTEPVPTTEPAPTTPEPEAPPTGTGTPVPTTTSEAPAPLPDTTSTPTG